MPRAKIANYIFYKIICNDISIKNCYIGMTTNFQSRKQGHRNLVESGFNLKVYNCIRENGGWVNWTMTIIEEYKDLSYIQAQEIEQNYINDLNADLNIQINHNVNRNDRQYINALEWSKKNKEARKLIQQRYRAKKLGLPLLEDKPKDDDKQDFEYYLKHKKEFEEYKEYIQNKTLFNEFKLFINKSI